MDTGGGGRPDSLGQRGDRLAVTTLDEALNCGKAGSLRLFWCLAPCCCRRTAGLSTMIWPYQSARWMAWKIWPRPPAGAGKIAAVHLKVETGMGRTGAFLR
jgi:alanine racemase